MNLKYISLFSPLFVASGFKTKVQIPDSEPQLALELHNGHNQFYARLGVGQPPQYFPMLLDSGSEEVWVPGPQCGDCDQDGKFFDPRRSKSFRSIPGSQTMNAGYASGEIWYDEVYESITCPLWNENMHRHSLLDDDTTDISLSPDSMPTSSGISLYGEESQLKYPTDALPQSKAITNFQNVMQTTAELFRNTNYGSENVQQIVDNLKGKFLNEISKEHLNVTNAAASNFGEKRTDSKLLSKACSSKELMCGNVETSKSQPDAATVDLKIGLTSRESPVFRTVPFDGIIGMAPSKSNFIEALYEGNAIKHKLAGINLRPQHEEMLVGHVPADRKVHWVDNVSHTGYWTVANVELGYTENGKHKTLQAPAIDDPQSVSAQANAALLPPGDDDLVIPSLMGIESSVMATPTKSQNLIAKKAVLNEEPNRPFRVIIDSGSSVAMLGEYAKNLVRSKVPCDSTLRLKFGSFVRDVDVYVSTRRKRGALTFGSDCDLDVMDLDGFDQDVIILGKDWFEQTETWFDWDNNKIGFSE